MPPSITAIDQCDAAWLSRVLGTGVEIDSIEPVGPGVGLLGEVHRVVLRSGPERSVIVKLPSSANVGIALQFGYYRREHGAYRDLLADAGLPTPRCLFNRLDDGLPCLVFEDLVDHVGGDQLAGLTRAQAEAAVDCAAALHARFWADSTLGGLDWMPGPEDDVISGYGALFEMTWPAFLAGTEVTDAVRRTCERAMTRFDDVVAGFADGPTTAVHGDFRLDNLLFGPDGAAAAIDWQLCARGRGPYDLAFLLAGSAEPGFRRTHERALVERYHRQLVARGVDDYPAEQAWEDYRRGHIMNLPNPVTAAVAVEPGNQRGRDLLQRNAERALAAVVDLWG